MQKKIAAATNGLKRLSTSRVSVKDAGSELAEPWSPTSANSLTPKPRYVFLDIAADMTRPSPLSTSGIEFWGHDLELMHHYSISTANSLATRSDMQFVWRVIVVEIGYSCPFVMHGVLAISALHKAHLIPSERDTYLDLAASHQNAGLEGFRAALPDMNNTTWEKFFSFASLVVFYVASLPVRIGKPSSLSLDLFNLFVFVRGIRAILEPYQMQLSRSRFAALVYGTCTTKPSDDHYSNPPMQYSPLPKDVFRAIQGVRAFFKENLQGAIGEEYVTAVVALEEAIYHMAHAGVNVEMGMLVFWPYVISENIMVDIETQNPYAMVLLAYFAIPLCVLEHRFWFLSGWSKRLFAQIDICLKDHQALLDMVKWPKEQVFELYGEV
ncbi:hypothetical protein FOBRF1_013465 [Fusarium oxysporum]